MSVIGPEAPLRAAWRKTDTRATAALPELTLVPRLLSGVRRRWIVLVVGGSVACVVGLAVLIYVWNAANEKTVSGGRAYFGPVSGAKLIGAHQRVVGHDPDSRTFSKRL